MLSFIKYFPFYWRLTEKRILNFLMLTFITIGFQGLSGAAFLPILELGTGTRGNNLITKNVFKILEYFGMHSEETILAPLLIFAVFCYAISSIGLICSEIYLAATQARIIHRVQTSIVKKLFGAEYAYFANQNLGFMNNAIINHTVSVTFSSKFYSNVLVNTLFAVAYLCFAMAVDFKMSALMLFAGLPLLFVIRLISLKNREYSAENAKAYGNINNIVIQLLTYFKFFKATNTSDSIEKHLDKCSRRVGFTIQKLAVWGSFGQSFMTPIAVALISLIVYYKFVVEKDSISDVIAAMLCLYAAYQRVITVPAAYQKFLGSTGPIKIFFQIESDLERHREKFLGTNNPDFRGSILFENIDFSYAADGQKILESLNIEIPANQTVAFVGESGAGKSTLVNIITGLFVPTSGQLKLSGTPYSDIDIAKLRKNISYVTQEPVIFNDTVHNNLTLWDSQLPEEKIYNASKRAHAHAFIEKMEKKYSTLLGSNGVNISGGQRQRISIARELLRDTKILILDEATSALDSETEQNIQESLSEMHGDKTIIIIAHRLSTVKHCDKIFVLDKGRIIEEGSYPDLYSKNGKFKEMVERQSL
jgi:subfamily B ATP-binding cassette protein MsbA